MTAMEGWPIEPFLYLSARAEALAAGGGDAGATLDCWRDGDLPYAADLLREAYTAEAGIDFAPTGEPEEWLRYVTLLVQDTLCGAFAPGVSRLVRDDGRLAALGLVTALSETTVHVAQLAVHPHRRRQGLATRLLAGVAAAAAAEGHEHVTLLVRESNLTARRLYALLGFTPLGMGLHYHLAS